MRLLPSDREWLRPTKIVQYMKREGDDPDVEKYNGGQRLFFFAIVHPYPDQRLCLLT